LLAGTLRTVSKPVVVVDVVASLVLLSFVCISTLQVGHCILFLDRH